MEDLWPNFDIQEINQNDAIQILREQARLIKSRTQGNISATFSKMKYKSGPSNTIHAITQTLSAFSSSMFEEVLDEELAEKKDVNDLYIITRYKFEIYNDEYRFRLFVLNYREMFPISLDIDEGILEDIQYKNGAPISSNNELKSTLREVFSSFKVTSVITKMLRIE